MTDAALVGRLLDEYHERSVRPADISVVEGSEHELRVSYRLTLPGGSGQIIRAFRADAPVPEHARGPGNEIITDWLLGRALTLWRKSTASIIREAARLGSRSIGSFPAQSESRPISQNVTLRPIAVGDSPLIPNVMRRCGHVSWLCEGVIDDFAMTVRIRAKT